MTAPPVVPQVYRMSSGLSSRPWPYFAGGVGLVAVAIFGFITSLSARTGPLQLHLSSTLPTILAVGLFSAGFRMARSPREVVLAPEGLWVKFRGGERVLNWGQIAWAEVQTQAVTNQKVLAIRGTDGKVLLTLPSSIEQFDHLVSAVQGRLTQHPSPAAPDVRWRKSRRTARALVVAAVLAAAGAAWTAWNAYDTHRSDELMRTQAVDGEAVIVRKFVAPDGHTHRIEYRVAGAGDDAKLHNVEVNELLWAFFKTGARVPVKTVPGHPEIARLKVGEVRDDSFEPSPMMNGLLSLALLVMSGLFVGGAVLGFKGIDISTDPITGKLKLERPPR